MHDWKAFTFGVAELATCGTETALALRIMSKPRRMQPWWLTDTTETCPACSQAYAYHTEIRCVDCDGPLCPICVQVTTTLELFCPGCFGTRDSESEASTNDGARNLERRA